MKSIRKFSVIHAVLTVALFLSASFAHAESAEHGRFTLPVAAHYKGVVLPAGEYTYSVQYSGAMTMLFVRSIDGKPGVFLSPQSMSDASPIGEASLVLTRRGNELFLTSFALPELGVVLHYSLPSGAEEAAAHSTMPAGTTMLAAAQSK